MPKLRILADASTLTGRSQKRGKLFEALMADVLRCFGYRVDRIPSVNYAGMEIDIEGTHIVTNLPLYAECKFYESDVDSPKLQAFFGKFVTRWLKNKRAHGLFIAIPGVNPHAKGFYEENIAHGEEFTVCLYQEDQILDALVRSGKVADPSTFARAVPENCGTAGEWVALVTEGGILVAQWIVPTGSVVPSKITLLNAFGAPITDRSSIESVLDLEPELRSFEYVTLGAREPLVQPTSEESEEIIVEVKGGTECFEFQFPASPEHFVGRNDILAEIVGLSADVAAGSAGARSVLFEANSGWGKSSCVLACADALRARDHYAVVIDSRSASSAQFVLRVVEHTTNQLATLNVSTAETFAGQRISGFDGAVTRLIDIGKGLQGSGQVLFIFLDQFENLFSLPDAFRRIRDLFLKVSTASTNVVLGFCWKTDLVGLTNDFPYQLRDSIRAASRLISISKFSEAETNALLDKLSIAIHARLRKDLRFFLSEFSQGYPWLLKKLCAHVKAQREAGVSQADIANRLLNVEQLFQEDLNGLTPDDEETLRRIARLSPVSVAEMSEEFKPQVVQSLIDRRLVVRIATKLDIYWDIFRDYLNSGEVPAQEQYLPRLGPRSIFRACRLLADEGKAVPIPQLASRLKVSSQSIYNVVHEMRTLGLAKVEGETVTAQIPPAQETAFLRAFSQYVGDKLRKNRLAHSILDILTTAEELRVADVANLLKDKCPYISANQTTWQSYAEIFCDWMEAGDLAIYDKKAAELSRYVPGRDVRGRQFVPARKRGGVQVLQVHYSPVEILALALTRFLVDHKWEWPAMKPSTREKALTTLEAFGFITRTPRTLSLTKEIHRFLAEGARPSVLLGESATKIPSFKEFLAILESRKARKCSLLQLGLDLKARMNVHWSDGTAQTTAKILLDWARHTELAPGVFAEPLRRRKKDVGEDGQGSLL